MGHIKTLNKWANAHTYYPLDFLRMALGILLFYQGVYFMSNLSLLADLYGPIELITDNVLLVHYIAPAHFIGGVLIVFGLLTRWAVLAQLPILIGAVLINFIGEMDTYNFLLSSSVLLLCVFFLFYGSGKHSVDKYLKMQQ
tara:strand:+ start:892 stop:1314 length:423 start_codon:yes stop_codon:yes gene_type:complete